MKARRLFLSYVYLIIFIFSIYAIIQTRLYVQNNITDDYAQFIFLTLNQEMSHGQFILTKLTLFFVTAIMSYILMVSNYFFYSRPDFEESIIKKINRSFKKKATR